MSLGAGIYRILPLNPSGPAHVGRGIVFQDKVTSRIPVHIHAMLPVGKRECGVNRGGNGVFLRIKIKMADNLGDCYH